MRKLALWRGVVALLGLTACATFSRPASACSLPGFVPHQTDSTTGDATAPGDLAALTYALTRSGNDDQSSCGDLAILTLNLEPPEDEQTPLEQLGFAIAAESVPDGLILPDGPVRAPQGSLTFAWPDDSSGGHGIVAFTLAVSAVDLAGNVGPPSELRVYDGGDTEACSVAPRGARGSVAPGFALMLVAFLTAARVIRRRV